MQVSVLVRGRGRARLELGRQRLALMTGCRWAPIVSGRGRARIEYGQERLALLAGCSALTSGAAPCDEHPFVPILFPMEFLMLINEFPEPLLRKTSIQLVPRFLFMGPQANTL